MLRFFIVLAILVGSSLACQGGFDSCIAKVRDTGSIVKNTLEIPLSATQTLLYTKTPPKSLKIVKHDPFFSLYLVEHKQKAKYVFTLNKYLSLGKASVNDTIAIEGKITKPQVGLNKLASFSEPLFAPSLLLNSCCFLEGIVTPDGIIEKAYLQRFITSKESDYGDIGIRLDTQKSKVVARDPFFEQNPFEIGDLLLRLDGKKIASASEAMEAILFSKIGTKHRVEVQRDSEVLTFEVTSRKRFGGGMISDTFLESKGVYLDAQMRIVQIDKERAPFGLALGDRILGSGGKILKSHRELRESFEGKNKGVNLLVERAGFQFFVQIN